MPRNLSALRAACRQLWRMRREDLVPYARHHQKMEVALYSRHQS